MSIAVIGSNNVDLITYIDRMPTEGETLEAPEFEIGCGGKGANQAVAAARLGAEVRFVGAVGDDMFGPNTLRNFERNGIDTTAVRTVPGASGVAPIFVDPSAHNRILIVKGANNAITPEVVVESRDHIADCSLIVLQLEIPLDAVYAAIDLGHELGIPVLLNPAPASRDLRFAQVEKCTYFMPNESELALLSGMPVDTLDEVEAAARSLMTKNLEHVIVTLGSRGVFWLHQDGSKQIAAHRVDAVDTTGAGDAFIGCFAQSLDSGLDIESALRRSIRYAADSVTKRGTQTSYATAEEMADRW